MLDPWTRSYEQARSLLDDILALPFHAEMRRHYQLSEEMSSSRQWSSDFTPTRS